MSTQALHQYRAACTSSFLRALTTQSWTQPAGRDTGIKVYNCIARKTVPVILRNGNVATWYTCGPTVYDESHIGHASCYVKMDIIQRLLRHYFNVNLVTAMNITDIDDKIIAKSHTTTKPWHEIARFYEAEFWKDMRKLHVKEPDLKVRVTENIGAIVDFIRAILAKNLAYVAKDNSVYFRIESCPNYGKLQRLNLEAASHDIKQSHIDFVLWKSRKENEPGWPSPWGEGRPGWHIECSALASKFFGGTVDFHAGGLDLKFPHHENEEAQSCAFHGCSQWVNYWLHTGHLSLKGQDDKMSKSLKNTVSVAELLAKYSSDDFRMACALSNYKNSMEFGEEMMQTARNTYQRFVAFDSDCRAYLQGMKNPEDVDQSKILQSLQTIEHLVDESLRSDFDTAKCAGHLLDLVGVVSREINKNENFETYSGRHAEAVCAVDNFVKKMLRVFGFQFGQEEVQSHEGLISSNDLVEEILAIRKIIRNQGIAAKSKDLLRISDEIRNSLKSKGIEIKDHKKGTTWNFT